ncbi:protein SMG8 [Rana temporaria]|uniref:protein SMG8 n=1 Tax=Rana temporaria TaxID=8407 RepID=UPI001AACA5F2|nr:protein SMG8 [Rana temporaria]
MKMTAGGPSLLRELLSSEPAWKEDEVCVVGVFGKTALLQGGWDKSCLVNSLCDRHVFPLFHRPPERARERSLFQTYYEQESRVLYVLLTGINDTAQLARACEELARGVPHAEAHEFWKDEEKLYCMHVLYLFCVCHLLLLVHPTCCFDIAYEKLFRALDSVRQKLLPSLKPALKECPVGLEWKLNARPCPPRLLFVFQLNGALRGVEPSGRGGGQLAADSKPKKHSPKRRLQHALEDQIYRIFRKSRVLTNQSINCLFTVPANQAFVYIVTDQDDDPIGMLLEGLRHHCTIKDTDSSGLAQPISGPRRFQMMRYSRQQLSFTAESSSGVSGQLVDCTLREFLFQHVELVLTKKGFDDSVGRNPQPSHFELPTYHKWAGVALKLYEVIIENKDDDPPAFPGGYPPKLLANMKVLEGYLDADTKFSENRCQKALPLAHSAYQSNLPHNYTTTVHKNQLAQALRVYSQHARGPAFQKYAIHLNEDCYKFWSSGHQLCEERSLTDQHCVHKFHLLPKPGEKIEPDRNPPILYHNSRARSTGNCNCGRKQAPREDPFDIKSANYDFYQMLEEKCCGKLDHINFPIFQPSTPDPAPAVNETTLTSQEGEVETEKLKDKEPQTQGESTSLSLALSLGQSTDSLGTYPAEPQAGGDNGDAPGQGSEDKGEKKPSLVDRQASTVEYLPGMMHSNCLKGLLPKFSSWSLLKLGSAKSYNFHTGLDQLGFIPGTNYLMPWDIVIRTRPEDEGDLDTNSWPAPNKSVPGKRSGVTMGRGRRRDDIARAFVGFEYEDSRGRRFMCSGPDKIMKVLGNGPKESAVKALNSDMPLYMLSPSQGRGLKPHYAQLMRLFVVVPDAPLQVILMPQVQSGSPPCPILFPEKQEITLPSDGLWVLRFPYSYVTERGPCYPPKENQQLVSYKVMRGILKAVTM